MKLSFLYFIFFTFLLSCSGHVKKAELQTYPEIPSDWKTLDENGYVIKYPLDWDLKRIDGPAFCILSRVMSADDKFCDNVNLVIEDLPEAVTIDRYCEYSLAKMKNYELIEYKKYITDGQEYIRIKSKNKKDEFYTQDCRIKDKKAYVLTFSFEQKESLEIKQTGDKVMRSFYLK